MKVLIFIFVTFCSWKVKASSPCTLPPVTNSATENFPDYYWRDYSGIIPPDAIPGGTDKLGNPTYIGQAYIQNVGLLPATIYRGCPTVRASAHIKEILTDKYVKILCAKDIQLLSWIATKNEETHLLTNYHFVIGGSEVEQPLNIGRVFNAGETIIGKVFSNPLGNRGLWIPNNGVEARFLSYEILAYSYNPKTCP